MLKILYLWRLASSDWWARAGQWCERTVRASCFRKFSAVVIPNVFILNFSLSSTWLFFNNISKACKYYIILHCNEFFNVLFKIFKISSEKLSLLRIFFKAYQTIFTLYPCFALYFLLFDWQYIFILVFREAISFSWFCSWALWEIKPLISVWLL